MSVEFPAKTSSGGALAVDRASRLGGRIVTVGRERQVVRALNDINLDIQAGDRIGIAGPNGSGKTTLLRTLKGVYHPTRGNLEVSGRLQTFFSLGFGLNDDASGYENIIIRGVIMGATPREMSERAAEIGEFTELGSYLEMPLRTYSAGMRMRLSFAVATSLPSDILLMDEWLSVGDASFRNKASERLDEVLKATGILVLASHNLDLLDRVCNRVITLESGCIVDERVV